MRKFNDINELDEWLASIRTYEEFWEEVEPGPEDHLEKTHCDDQIVRGITDKETALSVLKGFERIRIKEAQQLEYNVKDPVFH